MPGSQVTFYADEDVDGRAIMWARHAGVAIVTVQESGLRSSSDTAHFRFALERGYVLVTGNFRDFEPLFYAHLAAAGSHPGMVFIAPGVRQNSRLIADTMQEFYEAGDPEDFADRILWVTG